MAVMQHDNFLRHRHRFNLIMGDIHNGRTKFAMQPHQLGAHLHAQFCIQIRQRFIKQNHFGSFHNSAADRHALTLPARQRRWLAVQQMLQFEHFGGFQYPLLNFGLVDLFQGQGKTDILCHRHMRIQGIRLKHHGNFALIRRHMVHRLPADLQLAAADIFEAGNHPQ